jgi:hypothetical protein
MSSDTVKPIPATHPPPATDPQPETPPSQSRTPAARPHTPPAQQLNLADEESLARDVEARVITAASSAADPAADPFAASAPQDPAAHRAAPVPAPPFGHADEALARDQDPWGGLPAPWQPLPEWLTQATPLATTQAATAPPMAAATAPTGGAAGPSAGAGTAVASGGGVSGGGGAAPQFAESGRSLEPTPVEQAVAAQTSATHAQVQPDIDALAHQVYTILKRRLSAERRRLG